ncbi:MAG: DUF4145 domain-containing protein [Candidatus Bathyarchaeota archaeon]
MKAFRRVKKVSISNEVKGEKPSERCSDKANEFEVTITLRVDGKQREYKVQAVAHSCFFKNTKLYLFADGGIWSNIQPEELMSETKVQDKYLTIEGLREQVQLSNEIVANFKEALGCYLNGYYNASVVMSRKLLEKVLIEEGASPNQRVCDMIKELVKCGILDDKLKDLADNIKYLGNIGAHVKEEEANKSDAEQALHFCDFLLTWLLGKVDKMPTS